MPTHVFIPSKGRPATQAYNLFNNNNFSVTHVVEPADKLAYQQANVPNLLVLPESNQGIAYVRNYILEHSRSIGAQWIWMVDDDVQGFGYAKQGKTIKGTSDILSSFQARVSPYKFPLNGINYCQYAWSYSNGKSRFYINRKTAEVCTLIYIPKITWQYRPRLNLKEDRDFCMQAIKYSDGIIVDTHSWFACPGVGSNAGGLQEHYKANNDALAAARFVAEWSPFAKLQKKGSRTDAKLDLKQYALSLGRQVS
jgi:hypothetical protein